ncbi:hypothetical protein D3C76_1220810 [compost metagenome]
MTIYGQLAQELIERRARHVQHFRIGPEAIHRRNDIQLRSGGVQRHRDRQRTVGCFPVHDHFGRQGVGSVMELDRQAELPVFDRGFACQLGAVVELNVGVVGRRGSGHGEGGLIRVSPVRRRRNHRRVHRITHGGANHVIAFFFVRQAPRSADPIPTAVGIRAGFVGGYPRSARSGQRLNVYDVEIAFDGYRLRQLQHGPLVVTQRRAVKRTG